MKVRFYGNLGDCIGREVELEVPAGGCTVAELRHRLASAYPALAAQLTRPSLRACVDDTIVGDAHLVGGNRSVEFFPPVSGG